MKLKTVSSSQYIDSLKIYKPVSAVLIVKTGTTSSQFANEIIELKRINSKTGNTTHVFPKCKVIDVAEISSQGEGFYRQGVTRSSAILSFSDTAVNLDNDKYIEVEFQSLSTSHTYTIYGIEASGAVDKIYVFNKMTVASGETVKKYVVGDNDLVALPISGIASLKVWTKDGATLEYQPDELSALMDIENDLINVNEKGATVSVKFGSENWYLLSLSQAKEFEIETTGGNVVFYLIDNK